MRLSVTRSREKAITAAPSRVGASGVPEPDASPLDAPPLGPVEGPQLHPPARNA